MRLARIRNFLISSVALASVSAIWATHALAQNWTALYAFGDSYSDSGAGYVDTNGPTAIVYLAADLGIPFTYSSAENADGYSLNFAVSGAKSGTSEGVRMRSASDAPGVNEKLLGRGMMNQVEDFTQRVKAGRIRFDPSATIFFIEGGLNDNSSQASTTVMNIEKEIRQLYAVGGRYFLIARLPVKIPAFSTQGARLNPALEKIPDDLKITLPEARIVASQWGRYFDNVMERPGANGISNTSEPCAARALFGDDPTPCAAPDVYYYYHDGHPSAAVHRIVGKQLKNDLLLFTPNPLNDAGADRKLGPK
jgi:phospholipase/lecithinase/hemolysin